MGQGRKISSEIVVSDATNHSHQWPAEGVQAGHSWGMLDLCLVDTETLWQSESWAKEWLPTLASRFSYGAGGGGFGKNCNPGYKDADLSVLYRGFQTSVFYKIAPFKRNTSSLRERFLSFLLGCIPCDCCIHGGTPGCLLQPMWKKEMCTDNHLSTVVRFTVATGISMSLPPAFQSHSQRYHLQWWGQCEAVSCQ